MAMMLAKGLRAGAITAGVTDVWSDLAARNGRTPTQPEERRDGISPEEEEQVRRVEEAELKLTELRRKSIAGR